MNFNVKAILAVLIIALLTGDLMANQKTTSGKKSSTTKRVSTSRNVLKPGNCPNVSGQVGICLEGCQSDSNCPGKQKCCSNGCGHVCTNPSATLRKKPSTTKRVSTTRNVVPKPGNCPNVSGQFGICVERCQNDFSCSGNQKCCSNGCGRVCTNPV